MLLVTQGTRVLQNAVIQCLERSLRRQLQTVDKTIQFIPAEQLVQTALPQVQILTYPA